MQLAAKDYGLFLADEDPKKGIWLEPGRNLGYYVLRTGVRLIIPSINHPSIKLSCPCLLNFQDLLEYRRKMRTLKVRMLDGTVKTMLVDDSQPVTNLMVVICTKIGTSHPAQTQINKYHIFSLRHNPRRGKPPFKITNPTYVCLSICLPGLSVGITNHDEYSLVRENLEEEAENKPNFGTLTLRRKKEEKEPRDQKMEQLKKKIKTDDEREWRGKTFYFILFYSFLGGDAPAPFYLFFFGTTLHFYLYFSSRNNMLLFGFF